MIIKFPATSNALKRQRQTETGNDSKKKPLYLLRERNRNDSLEISPEARKSFEKNKTIDIQQERLKKEALQYKEFLETKINFREADLRKVYRLDKILQAKEKIKTDFYDRLSNEELGSILKKPLIKS